MGDERVCIDMVELREAVSRLLDAAAQRFGSTVDLAADHYWLLEAADAFNLEREPAPNAGKLSGDVYGIRELLARTDGTVYLWHDLQQVIGVLLALANLDRLPASSDRA